MFCFRINYFISLSGLSFFYLNAKEGKIVGFQRISNVPSLLLNKCRVL